MPEPNRSSRRQFLAASVATTSVLTAGLSLSRGIHAAGTERFNVILVGAGGRGTGAAADCLRAARHIKLVAVADAFEDQARLSRKSLQAMFGDQIDVPDERLFVGLDAFQEALACDADLISNVRDRKEEVLSPYLQEHVDLLDAIWNDRPYHEGWFGATSSFTSILGREASYSGQVVKWDELAEKGPSLFPERLAWDADLPVMPDENGSYAYLVPIPGIYKPPVAGPTSRCGRREAQCPVHPTPRRP
jgi:hypothetical protein